MKRKRHPGNKSVRDAKRMSTDVRESGAKAKGAKGKGTVLPGAGHSVSFSGSVDPERTLTTAQREKIQEKASCNRRRPEREEAGGKEANGLRIKRREIKLQRAQGGCPGTIRRRRTWQAAKSYGEPQAGTDP